MHLLAEDALTQHQSDPEIKVAILLQMPVSNSHLFDAALLERHAHLRVQQHSTKLHAQTHNPVTSLSTLPPNPSPPHAPSQPLNPSQLDPPKASPSDLRSSAPYSVRLKAVQVELPALSRRPPPHPHLLPCRLPAPNPPLPDGFHLRRPRDTASGPVRRCQRHTRRSSSSLITWRRNVCGLRRRRWWYALARCLCCLS